MHCTTVKDGNEKVSSETKLKNSTESTLKRSVEILETNEGISFIFRFAILVFDSCFSSLSVILSFRLRFVFSFSETKVGKCFSLEPKADFNVFEFMNEFIISLSRIVRNRQSHKHVVAAVQQIMRISFFAPSQL